MAARPVKVLPEGKEWLYEPKLDGYRALLLRVDCGSTRRTR